MADFSEFRIEVEKHLSKLGKDIQQFVEKVIPVSSEEEGFEPGCDIVESENEYKILMDLPGLTRKEISVSLKENVLTVKGEREIMLEEGEEFRRQERRRGAFIRSFALPEEVDAARIDANFRNGVLAVAMPKSEKLQGGQSIPVK